MIAQIQPISINEAVAFQPASAHDTKGEAHSPNAGASAAQATSPEVNRAYASDALAPLLARVVDQREFPTVDASGDRRREVIARSWGPILARGTGGSKQEQKEKKKPKTNDEIARHIGRCRTALDALTTYWIPDYQLMQAQDRLVPDEEMAKRGKELKTIEKERFAQSRSQALNPTTVSVTILRNGLKKARDCRAAECTTFAYAAAAILIDTDALTAPRVEVVARRAGYAGSHVFVLVGRPPGTDLNTPTAWADRTWLVDAWFGAAGHSVAMRVSESFVVHEKALEPIFDSRPG